LAGREPDGRKERLTRLDARLGSPILCKEFSGDAGITEKKGTKMSEETQAKTSASSDGPQSSQTSSGSGHGSGHGSSHGSGHASGPGQRSGGRPGGGPGGRGKFFRRKKVCKFCTEKIDAIPYRDVRLLQQFVAERGKIVPRRLSGVCTTHQRRLTRSIKQARNIALLPFATRH
jgi:small subunit ribosomal protein S18